MIHRTLIVPLAHVPLADALCSALAGPAGSGMFTTRLQPAGGGAASHAIGSGQIEEQFAALLPLYDAPGQPETIFALAQQAGAPVTLEQITELLDVVDVSEGDPFGRMAALGLALEQVAP